MTLPPRRLNSEAPPSDAKDEASERRVILVTPDQISQRDTRPWRRTTLGQALAPFLVVSAVVVAIGTLVIVLALRLVL